MHPRPAPRPAEHGVRRHARPHPQSMEDAARILNFRFILHVVTCETVGPALTPSFRFGQSAVVPGGRETQDGPGRRGGGERPMDIFEAIERRHSYRGNFHSRPFPREVLRRL